MGQVTMLGYLSQTDAAVWTDDCLRNIDTYAIVSTAAPFICGFDICFRKGRRFLTRILHPFLLSLVMMTAFGLSSPLHAQEDCSSTRTETTPNFQSEQDCTISWVDNGQLQTVIWRAVQDDFEQAGLEEPSTGAVITSSYLPELIDVDMDGWLDLVSWTRAGMVNGLFEVFFYDPVRGNFVPAQPLFGHTLARDQDGYIVVASRSGPSTVKRFFSAVDHELEFNFEIDPYALKPSRIDVGFNCDVSPISSGGVREDQIGAVGAVPYDLELLRYYCDPEPAPDRPTRHYELVEDVDSVDRVPTRTVFFCRLTGGTHAVTVSQTSEGMRYTFGPLRGDLELVMERGMDHVDVLSDNGAGPSRFGYISFENAEYTYTVHYGYEIELTRDSADVSETTRGLTVRQDDDPVYVFDEDCLNETSFDQIFHLD